MPHVLTLSTSALTDRMLVHSGFLPAVNAHAHVHIWATSADNSRFRPMWEAVPANVELFPEIRALPEYPHNYLRRLNDFAWDFYLRDPTRLSILRHVRDRSNRWHTRILKHPARVIARAGLHTALENHVQRMIVAFERSPEATRRLSALRPDVVLSTGTFRYEEPAVVTSARRLGIDILGLVTSWDNISIKNRMVLKYDGYIVWSPQMKSELLRSYPHASNVPVYIVGAPQFDVFFERSRYISREQFCGPLQLDAARPIIVHAMGVANGIEEHHSAVDLAERLTRGELGNAQLIVRPHPFQNHLDLRAMFSRFGPDVVLQQDGNPSEPRLVRSQDDQSVNQWVNTFRHADVVVHLSSTVAIDAALFDCPSVCLDYDPMPGQRRQALVRDVNHLWTHYKPVADSGGTWLVNNPDELVAAVRTYLANRGLHAAERRRMAEYVCGYSDGRCGERLAAAVVDFAMLNHPRTRAVQEACV